MKKESEEIINQWRINIATKNGWAVRALLFIHKQQKPEEQYTGLVSTRDGVGFNKLDSEILTGLAHTWLRTGRLTHKQLDLIKHRMPKYARQIYKTKYND